MESPYNHQTNSGHFKEVRYDAYNRPSGVVQQNETGGVHIKKLICRAFNTTPERVFCEGRGREQTTVRFVYMYIMQKMTTYTQREIGILAQGTRKRHFDHATVIYSLSVVENLLQTDKVFREKFERLMDDISKNHINYEN